MVSAFQSRVLSDIPFLEAIIVTAPTVRFSDFEIFATPTFCFARPFNILRSVAVHGRMVRAFFANCFSSHEMLGARLSKSSLAIKN